MEQYSGQGGAKSTTRAKFFRLGMLTFEKQTPKSNFTGFRGGIYALWSYTGQQYLSRSVPLLHAQWYGLLVFVHWEIHVDGTHLY